jgi:hypothetical protein
MQRTRGTGGSATAKELAMKAMPTVRRCLAGAAVLVICLCYISCTKVNRSNFEKIQEGMSLAEVIEILGEPADRSEIDLSFVTGAAAQWEDEKTGRKISVQFLNGKVRFKQYEDREY